MAEVGHATEFSAQGTAATTGSGTFAKPGASGEWEILGSELDDSSEYLLIVRMHVGGDFTAGNEFEFKVVEDSVGDLTGSHMLYEPRRASSANGSPYTYMRVLTTASTANDYEIHFKSSGSDTASMVDLEMVMIKLDDLASGDWAYDNDPTDNSFSGGVYEDGASITIGDGTSDWLIVSTAQWQIDSVTDDCLGRIDIGGSPVMNYSHEGEDTAEELVIGSFHYEAALASSTTVKNEFTNTDGSNDVLDNSIFALRLNAFEDHAGGRNTTKTDSNGSTPVQPIGLTYTTTTAADPQEWIAFGQSLSSTQASDQRKTRTSLRVGGTDFAGNDQSVPHFSTNGSADDQTLNRIGVSDQDDDTDLDWDFSASDDGGQTGLDHDEQILCGFSWVKGVTIVEGAASTSIAFGETPGLTSFGALAASESIAFGETVVWSAQVAIAASTPIAFGESAGIDAFVISDIAVSDGLTFGESAGLDAFTIMDIEVSDGFTFGHSAGIDAHLFGDIAVSADITFNHNVVGSTFIDQPVLPVIIPSFRSVDGKTLADAFNRGLPQVPVYDWPNRRKFYELDE
jgi:hypothetical protein